MNDYIRMENGGIGGDPDFIKRGNIIVVTLEDSHNADEEWVGITKKMQKLKGSNAIYFMNDEYFPELFMDMLVHFPGNKAEGYGANKV